MVLSLSVCALSAGCSAENKTSAPEVAQLDDVAAYKEIFGADTPVLIQFCTEGEQSQRLSRIVDEISGSHRAQFKVVRMNSPKSPETMQLFDVTFVPCLVFVSKKQCKHGKKMEGFTEQKEVEVFVEQSLIQCRE